MLAFALLALLGAAPAETPAGEDPAGAFVAELAAHREQVETVRASFYQETKTPDQTMRATGTFIYVRPDRLALQYESDDAAFIIDGLRVYDYDGLLEQAQIFKLDDKPETEALFLGFSSDVDKLKQAYALDLIDPVEVPEAEWCLVLTPKPAEEGEPLFQRVYIWGGGPDYMPLRLLIVNGPDTRVVFRFSNAKVNARIEPGEASVALPEGTVIVHPDETVENVTRPGFILPEPLEGPAGSAEEAE
jgi:outer membrane lipoprotein-sorting protein